MIDPKVADPRKQDFDDTAAKIVGDQKIGINQMQLVDEHLKHLALILEHGDICVLSLFYLLLEVMGERLLV